jgi:putative hydrolase of the HAD superfamily
LVAAITTAGICRIYQNGRTGAVGCAGERADGNRMTRGWSARCWCFDLDDTLFDHARCARCALEAVYHAAQLDGMAFDEFSRRHAGLLEELHRDVLAGPPDDRRGAGGAVPAAARRRRGAGAAALARETAARYRDRYVAERRAVEGAAALLAAVRTRAAVGIVTNNIRDEQVEKLRACGLDGHVDVLLASEEAGVSKPDPAIFQDRPRAPRMRPGRRGDGRRFVGRRRRRRARGRHRPDLVQPRRRRRRPSRMCPVLRALTPVEPALRTIFDAHRR